MIHIIHTNITKVKADIIVNAANEYLSHGGGVALAISQAGGPIINKESKEWIKKNGHLEVGGTAVTSAGNLKAKWIIHVVGPRGTRPQFLRKAINNVFKKAIKLNAKSIALPAVSCGIFGFDKKKGAEIIYNASKEYSDKMDIYLVSLDKEIIKYWKHHKTLNTLLPCF